MMGEDLDPIVEFVPMKGAPRRKRKSTIQPPVLVTHDDCKITLCVPQTSPIPARRKSSVKSISESEAIAKACTEELRASLPLPSNLEKETSGTIAAPQGQLNIARPTSATPLMYRSSPVQNLNHKRRYSTYTRPVIDYENSFNAGAGGTLALATHDPRRASVSVLDPNLRLLGSGVKDLDFHPPPQHQRGRRISFGLGGVPKAGYWGVGVGGNLENDSDSEDSLLAQTSRKPSRSNPRGPTLMGYNRRQWHYLIVFAIVDFCSALVLSIQGPIYPREAEQKQVTATECGLVFGVFEFTILIMCPIFGKLLGTISPQSLFNGGVFTTGISIIIFGFLSDIDDPATFMTMSFILRIIEGAGDAACMTAAYAIITAECPDTVSTTFIFLKTWWVVGYTAGPLIGASLYTAGGFLLPFVILGTILFCAALFTLFMIPKPISHNLESSGESNANAVDKCNKGTTTGFIKLLKSPTVVLVAFSIISGSASFGFLNATLEPHIRNFTSSTTTVGLVYILNGGMNSISSPLWGWICHLVPDPKYINLIGAVLTFSAFLLIGPAPFLPIDTHLWLTCVGLVIQGIGIGAIFVSGFLLALRDSIDKGYPDDESTYGLVSGLYTSLFTAGNMIGPSISGILVDNFGFQWATVFVLGSQASLVFLLVCFIIYDGITRVFKTKSYSDFDDESYSALQVSESQEEDWEESKYPHSPASTAITNSI